MFNDQMESVAIERAGLNEIPVNAYKGYFGHTLGAAGVLETILSMAAADDHTILGTRGFEERGVSGKIKLSNQNAATNGQQFIKMISGFGGCNGAILGVNSERVNSERVNSERVNSERVNSERVNSEKLMTHTVEITPKAVTVDGKQMACEGEGKALLTDLYKRYIDNYPKFYKMDPLCRLGFVASELLLQAEGNRRDTPRDDRAIILFNRSSSIQADEAYQASIQDAEDYFPSPAAFVYTLPNIVTGEIAIRNHYQGETSFYILPERNDQLMQQILKASLGDKTTKSILGGWIDYEDDENFVAKAFTM